MSSVDELDLDAVGEGESSATAIAQCDWRFEGSLKAMLTHDAISEV